MKMELGKSIVRLGGRMLLAEEDHLQWLKLSAHISSLPCLLHAPPIFYDLVTQIIFCLVKNTNYEAR